jgi:hypothetical protein
MPTALYFVQGKLLGQSEFLCRLPPHSLAYFCPTCGEVWARIVVTEASYWSVEHVACEKHLPRGVPDWGKIPGTLCPSISSWKKDLSILWWGRALEHLPPAVLQREFDLTLTHYERLLSCTSSEVLSS